MESWRRPYDGESNRGPGRLGAGLILEAVALGLTMGLLPFLLAKPERRNPLRERLLDLIRRTPGVRLSTLWKTTQANRGTARYHLLMLERTQEVEARREAKNLTRYFPKGCTPQELVLLSLLRRGRVLDVVKEILKQPGITQREITERLLLSRKVFRSYADLLLREELLREVREANQKRYFPTERLIETFDRVDVGAPRDNEQKHAPGGIPR